MTSRPTHKEKFQRIKKVENKKIKNSVFFVLFNFLFRKMFLFND